jgi:HEAT repeat protein
MRLNELASDSVELNFDNIFLSSIRDPEADVRSEAINGLWENEQPALIPVLIDLLNNDPEEKVQATAAQALGRFALMAEINSIAPKYAIQVGQALLDVFNDRNKSIEVRRRALEAVSPLTTEQVKTAIKTAYESLDERLKISAVYAMGKNCDNKWLPFVLKELKNSDAEIRYEAVTACGEIADEDIMQYLIPAANDEDIDVQLAVIQALGKIGGNEAKLYLQKHADEPNEALRDAIETALKEISILGDMNVLDIAPQPDNHEH